MAEEQEEYYDAYETADHHRSNLTAGIEAFTFLEEIGPDDILVVKAGMKRELTRGKVDALRLVLYSLSELLPEAAEKKTKEDDEED